MIHNSEIQKNTLEAIATAQESSEKTAAAKRPGDQHRHKGRLSARMPQDQISRVQDDVKVFSCGAVQNWIDTCTYRLLYDADKRRKAPAVQTEKAPPGRQSRKGQQRKICQ